ncbi:DUF998 domain-containing protein [Erysipelothrix sp. HDW6C]|uniref:DUF998 domain-containing protein n=1 Tax=Erysipelothrix sp. HDW6C TaxID=2714930 RepID=UPI00140C1DAE|nr:DUF998 domain-containing protein [Erysipelothrix sp. HDW6C]QIK69844.1 DUF998 domain-containing protein [Erysipelothrix sp. HDW6C]
MNNKTIQMIVTDEFANEQTITLPLTMPLEINDTEIKIPLQKKKRLRKSPLSFIIVASLTLLICILVFHGYRQIPLVGDQSAATLILLIGLISGMINFTLQFIQHKGKADEHAAHYISWRIFPVLLLSFSLLIFVGTLFLFRVLGQLFYGASFDIYTTTIIVILFVTIMNNIMMTLANNLSPTSIIRSLVAIIFGGVGIAMITNKDQQWWLANLSFLGTPEATRSWEFNLTLILSAFLMMALIDYLFVLLYQKMGKNNGLRILKGLLLATALCLGGVGFFPYNESAFYQNMHNRVAGYLVYLFLILIISIKWLLPTIERRFLQLSYAIGGLLIVSVYLFLGIHYLSLTAFELIAFVLAFSWLLMLLQALINIINKPDSTYTIVIKRMPTYK